MNPAAFAAAVIGRQALRFAQPRRRKPMPAQQQPNAIRLAYSNALRPLLEQMRALVDTRVVPSLPEFVRVAGQVHDSAVGHADAAVGPLNYAAKFSALIRSTSQDLFKRFSNERLRALALQFGERTSTHQKQQLAAQFVAALGIDPMSSEPWLKPVLKAFAHTNALLIKSVPERYFAEIESRTLNSLRTGERAETIARDYQDRYGVSESRARLIARDQVGKLNGQLNVARQRRAGIQKWTWRTSEDERVRPEHEDLDGKVFAIDDPPSEGYPGEPINCFPGDQKISFAPGVMKLYRRLYSGELTELVTDSGEVLRATPNHPILSRQGWVPAHLLNVGDDVFEAPAQGIEGAVTDPERADAALDEFFRAVAALGFAHRVPGRTAWFHGDVSDEQVDIVDVDWGLRNELDPSLSQRFCQNALTLADYPNLGVGPSQILFKGLAGAAPSAVRGFCKAHALFGAGGGHSGDHRVAAVAWLNAVANQSATNGEARNAVLLRELLYAPSGEMQSRGFISRVLFGIAGRAVVPVAGLNAAFSQPSAEEIAVHVQGRRCLGDGLAAIEKPRRIVEKRVGNLESGHVYNLQTVSGWYVSQSLIVHNCRCSSEPDVQSEIDALGGDGDGGVPPGGGSGGGGGGKGDRPASEWYPAGSGDGPQPPWLMEKGVPGTVNEDLARFDHLDEVKLARYLASQGNDVVALHRDPRSEERFADAAVNGAAVEFGRVIPKARRSGPAALRNRIRVKAHKAQARAAIIDVRGTGLSENEAKIATMRAGKRELRFVRIVGDHFDFTVRGKT